jgi:hypothetical protein
VNTKIVVGLLAGAALIATYYAEESLDTHDAAIVKNMQGPEALEWLKKSENESALASNRFATTQDAVRFVQRLYDAGAVRVIVPNETITSDEVEVYADGLVVTLPEEQNKRQRVWILCAEEIKRSGEKPTKSPSESHVFLWWD